MSVRPAGDPAYLAQARRGDEAAFAALVRDYADVVFGHALRFFGDRSSAEDATQEVFIKVFRTIGSFDGRAQFSTWLYRVTQNVCLDLARAGRRVPVPVDPDTIDPPHAPDFSDDLVTGDALEAAIAMLPAEEKAALGAVTLYGMSYQDAAGALGVPVGTVKSRVFRARKTLLALLAEGEGGVGGGVPARN